MTYCSEKPLDIYIRDIKSQLSNFSNFGVERFTGIILGRFFSISHHCGYEWNRRITNEKHRAIGYVSACDEGTKITCIRLAGMTNPLSLVLIYLFCLLLSLLTGVGGEAFSLPGLLLYAVITLVAALVTAISSSVTERGQEGSRTLTAFLLDPANYYSML